VSRHRSVVWPTLVGAVVVALAAAIVHLGALSGGFVYDDVENVLRNPWVREPGRWFEAFSHHMAAFTGRFNTSYYRPVMHVVLACARGLSGLKPAGYHALLLLMHGLAAGAVFLLAARTIAAGRMPAGRGGLSGPFAGALVFAFHPVHVEAVAWISGVVDLSAGMLAVLALVAALSPGRLGSLVAAPTLFLAALLAKEPAVMIVPALAAYFAARGDWRDTRRRARGAAVIAALGLALATYLLLRVNALGGLMGTEGAERVRVPAAQAVATAIALLGEYVRLLAVPWPLSAVHDFRVVTSPTDPRLWLGVVVGAGLATAAWRWRKDAPVVLGVALAILPLLPALYVPVLGEGLVAERYLYLPTVGLSLLVARGWDAAREWSGWRKAFLVGGLALVLIMAGWATVWRTAAWRDDLTLWQDAATKVPGSAAAHEYLGAARYQRGDVAAARASYVRALEIDPGRWTARTGLAALLAAEGRHEEAIEAAQAAHRSRPGQPEPLAIAGYSLATQGRLAEAVESYARAIAIAPAVASTHNQLAIALAAQGDGEGAEREFREAVRLEPSNASYARNLALLRSQRK